MKAFFLIILEQPENDAYSIQLPSPVNFKTPGGAEISLEDFVMNVPGKKLLFGKNEFKVGATGCVQYPSKVVGLSGTF